VVGKSPAAGTRLARILIGNYARLDGSFPQVDLLSLPARRILNIVYVWMLDHLHGEDREKWLAELDSPLPGEKPDNSSFDDSFHQIHQ
jgi:hypothetical protein